MRLLNVKSLVFEEFLGEVGHGIPIYAILSHTWGAEEVSYSDHINQQSPKKKGYQKLVGCCRVAEAEGFQYVWIDTCCIDKSSSAELSEAINSMFRWDRDAGICYAYLNDVNSAEDPTKDGSSFGRSRWFTRGWTLQELLAPAELVFLGSDWLEIGTKKSLCKTVSSITRISQKVLEECHWDEYSVAQKMSWAARRNTTRLEDEAYCLMGLFDVNMPLLYGEGRKAFSRLQQEILKQTDDQSIFAWSYPEELQSHTQLSGLMAPSVEYFRDAFSIELLGHEDGEGYENPFEVVNHLIRLRLPLVDRIEAMKLQKWQGKPLLYNVVEIQKDGGSSQKRLSTPDLHPDEVIKMDEPPVRTQQLLPAIEIQDTTSEPDTDGSSVPPAFLSTKMENSAVSAGLGRATIEEKEGDFHIRDPSLEPVESTSPAIWYWHIYEPVMIVPLRCHICGHRLGILLSKGSIRTGSRVLSRIHNPSIIGAGAVHNAQFTPLMTVYASMLTKMPKINNGLKDLDSVSDPMPTKMPKINKILDSDLDSDPMPCPEIRVASLLSAGYIVHVDSTLGWEFDRSRAALVQKNKFRYAGHIKDDKSFALFYRRSKIGTTSSTAQVFFVSMPTSRKNDLKYEIGVSMDIPTSFTVWDYNLYSIDLARGRRVEVPLGGGKAAVIKYREGPRISFVIISLETLNEALSRRKKRPIFVRAPAPTPQFFYLSST